MTSTTTARPDTEQRVAATFPQDVAGHTMTVLQDDGLHRHLRFAAPSSSNLWFELVTWPGALAINGDMGTYVFARTTDMFAFFGPDRRVNLSYWAEKTRSGPHRNDGGIKEFDEDSFRKQVEEQAKDWISDYEMTPEAEERLRDALAADVLTGEASAYRETAYAALEDFSTTIDWTDEHGNDFSETFEFTDVWEYDLTDWVYQFVWCCHAITWGIGRYIAAGGTIVTNADWIRRDQYPASKADTLAAGVSALVEDLTVLLGLDAESDLRARLDAWRDNPLAAARQEAAERAAAGGDDVQDDDDYDGPTGRPVTDVVGSL